MLTGLLVSSDQRIRHIGVDLGSRNLGVIDGNVGLLCTKALDERDGRRSAGIASVLLECKTENSDLLVRDGVEQLSIGGMFSLMVSEDLLVSTYTADDGLCESSHLVVIHLCDLAPSNAKDQLQCGRRPAAQLTSMQRLQANVSFRKGRPS